MKNLTRQKTILIVDDEKEIRRLFERIMSMHGYNTLSAADAFEALVKVQDNKVDLLLTDVRMPGMNGLDLIGQVHDLDPLLPVIVITGYGTIETAIDAIERGAFFFISKPIETASLIEIVKRGLRLPCRADIDTHASEGIDYTIDIDIGADKNSIETASFHLSAIAKNLGMESKVWQIKLPFVLDELLTKAVKTCEKEGVDEKVGLTAHLDKNKIECTITSPVEAFHSEDLPLSMEETDITSTRSVSLLVATYYTATLLFAGNAKSVTFTF